MSIQNEAHRSRLPYTFSIGKLSEIEEYSAVNTAAFQGPLLDAIFPGRTVDPKGYDTFRKAQILKQFEDPNVQWAKVARSDTGEVIAVGKWEFTDGKPSHSPQASEEREDLIWDGFDNQFFTMFRGTLDEHHEKNMGPRPHYSMWPSLHEYASDISFLCLIAVQILATKPEYQGRGAISPIIRHILAEAKEKDLPVYIEASPAGLPVYRYFGWKDLPEIIKVPLPSGDLVEMAPMLFEVTSG
jgi:GNAT superfamily N-acetyltransferase